MLTNQKHPGETDTEGNSKASVTGGVNSQATKKAVAVNQAGGTSKLVEDHDNNRFGAPLPASSFHPVDSDVNPLVTRQQHYGSDGEHLGSTEHDHSPAPEAFDHQPVHPDDAQTLEYDSASGTHKPVKPQSNGTSVRTSGAIGNHYH